MFSFSLLLGETRDCLPLVLIVDVEQDDSDVVDLTAAETEECKLSAPERVTLDTISLLGGTLGRGVSGRRLVEVNAAVSLASGFIGGIGGIDLLRLKST